LPESVCRNSLEIIVIKTLILFHKAEELLFGFVVNIIGIIVVSILYSSIISMYMTKNNRNTDNTDNMDVS